MFNYKERVTRPIEWIKHPTEDIFRLISRAIYLLIKLVAHKKPVEIKEIDIAKIKINCLNFMSLAEKYSISEIEKLQIELSSIRRLTVELEEGLIELRELQNSNKVFEEEKEDVVEAEA